MTARRRQLRAIRASKLDSGRRGISVIVDRRMSSAVRVPAGYWRRRIGVLPFADYVRVALRRPIAETA